MFDLHTPILDEYEEEVDGERLDEYIDALMNEFAESPEGQAYRERYGDDCYLPPFMGYAADYFCASVATISVGEAQEILFDLFPRKVSAEPEDAAAVIAEQRAFWQYLKRTRSLPQADGILELLTDEAADELEERLADEGNFGMAKSFFATGEAAGFDMQSEEGINAFMTLYNASLAGKSLRPDRSVADEDDLEPSFAVAPIQKEQPRVGRNERCPCGSGRKYKKCCGVS